MQCNRQLGPINTALGGLIEKPISWGENHHQSFEERNEKLIPITAIIEDLPELHNEVIIDGTLTDSNGIPSPKVNYTTSENSKKILDFSVFFQVSGVPDPSHWIDPADSVENAAPNPENGPERSHNLTF